MMLTRAEQIAVSLVTMMIGGVAIPYFTDLLGVGVQPAATAGVVIIVGVLVAVGLRRHVHGGRSDSLIFAGIVAVTAGYLLWLAWPSLLPPGAGSDLTHHLVLVEYIERNGSLVHETDGNGLLGEMADYTPGMHVLAVLAGAITRTSGFAATYPMLVATVALKAGVLFLILLRVLTHHPQRTLLALCGVGLLAHASTYTLRSFIHDSFLAQVTSELFAIVMWWAIVSWEQEPRPAAAAAFGMAGAATFLTWPIWVGPPALAFFIVAMVRRHTTIEVRSRHLAIAFAPIALVASLHLLGRSTALSMAGTSGAVAAPSPALLGWWLLVLAPVGLVMSAIYRPYRTVLIFAGAIALQSVALLVVARRSGADTPYMAIKMTYLAVYPITAAAVICLSRVAHSRAVAAVAALVILTTAVQGLSTQSRPTPLVSHDLWTAGHWARKQLAPTCVDYLVPHADTSYWLHLAVLGNRRASERTTSDDTFDMQRAAERWLSGEGLPYAIADLSRLPADLRDRGRVIYQSGSAAVLQRRDSAVARERCRTASDSS